MANNLAPEEVISARREVCAGCSSNKDMTGNSLYMFVDSLGAPIPEAVKNICMECKCPIIFRTRKAHHACPLGKWGEY